MLVAALLAAAARLRRRRAGFGAGGAQATVLLFLLPALGSKPAVGMLPVSPLARSMLHHHAAALLLGQAIDTPH